MFTLEMPLVRAVLGPRAEQAPAAADDLRSHYDVICAVDDAAAWAFDGAGVHVEPFCQHSPSGERISEFLFVTVRYGALAASQMVEVDTTQLAEARTWLEALQLLTGRINDATASIAHSFPPPAPTDTLMQRLVDRDAIRSEIDDNPNLTDGERASLAAASDDDIDDALEQCGRGIEDRLFALHDELQAAAINHLTT